MPSAVRDVLADDLSAVAHGFGAAPAADGEGAHINHPARGGVGERMPLMAGGVAVADDLATVAQAVGMALGAAREGAEISERRSSRRARGPKHAQPDERHQ